MGKDLQDEIGESRGDQRAYGNALEEEHACHGADDQSRYHLRRAFQEGHAASACHGGKQARKHRNDAERGLEGVDHGMERYRPIGNRNEDRRGQQDNAPIQPLGAQCFQRGIEPQHLDAEYDGSCVDNGHIVSDDAENQHRQQSNIFRVQKIISFLTCTYSVHVKGNRG